MSPNINNNGSATVKKSALLYTCTETVGEQVGETSNLSSDVDLSGYKAAALKSILKHTVGKEISENNNSLTSTSSKQASGKKLIGNNTGEKEQSKAQASGSHIGAEELVEKDTGAMETIEMQAGGSEKDSGVTAADEKQSDDHLNLSSRDLKLALSVSGGLAVVNPQLYSEQESKRQECFKKTISKKSSAVCPPLESRKYFFPFKKLPPELRQEIWKLELATREPRIIKLYHDEKKARAPIRSKTGVPIILHVCSESRMLGLRAYKPLVINGYFTGTFIEWERDVIYINNDKCLETLMALPEMRSGVAELNQMCHRLALDDRGLWSFVEDFDANTHFPELEELVKSFASVGEAGCKNEG